MVKKIVVLFLSLFCSSGVFAEGFGIFTPILTTRGIVAFKDLVPGMEVFCATADGAITTSPIVSAEYVLVPTYYTIKINGLWYDVSGSQLFYCVNRKEWVKFCELDTDNDTIIVKYDQIGHIKEVREHNPIFIKKQGLLRKISVKDHHTFFFADGTLCHNYGAALAPLWTVVGNRIFWITIATVIRSLVSPAVHKAFDSIDKAWQKPSDDANLKGDDNDSQETPPPGDDAGGESNDQEPKDPKDQEPENKDPKDLKRGVFGEKSATREHYEKQSNPELKRSKKGISKQIEKHEQKLEEYTESPDACDNLGRLQGLDKETRELRIQERKESLVKQINGFKYTLSEIIAILTERGVL